MKKRIGCTTVGAVLLLSVPMAHADITVYTDRTAFLAAVGATASDTFMDLEPGFLDSPLTRATGAVGYTVSTEASTDGLYAMRPASGGTWLTPTVASDALTFTGFTAPVRGFGGGFFGTDVFGNVVDPGPLVLTAVDADGSLTYTLEHPEANSFIGFLATSGLKQVSLSTHDTEANVYWATTSDVLLAVPEPASWAMLSVGLGMGLLLTRRRA
ncbi:PEP-CTERM sorting domain-containing protein [Zemynaea arenosa]|nr:PEP-CTERM sorting domain-containing protein [Massilia arenosa]